MVIVHTFCETILYFPNSWEQYWMSLILSQTDMNSLDMF